MNTARMQATHDDQEAISKLLEAYRDGFHRLDSRQLCSLWDKHHEDLIYVAGELSTSLHGWNAIKDYYTRATDSPEPMLAMTLDAVSIQTFGDTALVFFNFLAVPEKNLELRGRVSMLCHRAGKDWKLIHYHESAPAAETEETSQEAT
jgi:ketosteroid isomerase-like protein